MKIALFVSGLIRRDDLGYKEVKEKIIDPNNDHDIDIYLDVWSNKLSKFENKGDKWRQNRRASLNLQDKQDLNKLYEWYNPLMFDVEDDTKSEYFINLTSQIRTGRVEKTTPYAILSQFYKLYMSNQRKKSYEKAFSFKYDMCVRTRDDLVLENKLDLDSFVVDNKKLYIEKEGYGYGWISDKFAIASSSVFDKYANFFTQIIRINALKHDECDTIPELYLKHWLIDDLDLEVIKDERIGKLIRSFDE